MTTVCKTSSISRRRRRTKAEIVSLREAILEIVKELRPITCRQTFYQLVVRDLIEKIQNEYTNTVCRLLAQMREDGDLPWEWVVDNTRWMRKPRTYSSLDQMLRNSIETYRRSVWDDQNAYVEIWCESDAVAGVIVDVTRQWDVPLMVSRGFSSRTFIHSAAENIAYEDKPAFLYYVGDYDPSGVHIDRRIEADLRRYAPGAEIHFQRIAVTPEQIDDYKLPGTPPKGGDKRTKSFAGAAAIEVEAIKPDILRNLVSECITQHIDDEVYERLLTVEQCERETLQTMFDQLRANG